MRKTMNTLMSSLLALLLSTSLLTAQNSSLLSVKKQGKGQAILLIHGMSCSADVWKDVAKHLEKNYEVHLVTLKGFGNKEEQETPHFLRQVRDEIIDYAKKEKLKNPILMGHSMGGFLSLWAAAEAPDLFSKIISVDGVPYFPALQMPGATPETMKEMTKNMQAGMMNMDEAAYKSQQEMIIATMIAKEDKRPEAVAMGMASSRKMTGQAYVEMMLTDIRPEVGKIKSPVLVLGAYAAYKQFGATAESVKMGMESQMKGAKNAEVRVAPNAFHFIFYDEPEWFFSQVDQFLKS